MKSTGFGISGYGLWIEGPWRAGLILSNDRLSTHFTDSYIGTDAKVKASAFGVQAAASYTGQLDDDTFFEPGAGLSYTSLGGTSFNDGAGNAVTIGATDSVLGTLSGRIGKTFNVDGTILKPYADLGVHYEFDGTTDVTIGNWSNTSGMRGASAQVGGGFTASIGDRVSLFGNVDYVAGDRQKGWQSFVGLRFTH